MQSTELLSFPSENTVLIPDINANTPLSDFAITKADDDKRLVFGWALVSATADGEKIIDYQGDIVEQEDLEEGAYEYVLNFRDAGEEHVPGLRKKARMVESVVFTEEKLKAMGIPAGTVPYGWWIGFYVDDDKTWELIKNGTYKMFSIEGRAVREPVTNEVTKSDSEVAKTFGEMVEKFNPYHDSRGRFASAGAAASFTYAPGKSKAHDLAIAREKERHAAMASEGKEENEPRRITLDERNKAMANNWSFMNDKGGYYEKLANEELDNFRSKFKRDDLTDEQKKYIDQREEEYAKLVTDQYNDLLYREGSNPSAMVAGPAKFNYARHDKKLQAEINSQNEFNEKKKRFVDNTEKQLKNMEPEEKQIDYWRKGKYKYGEKIDPADPLAERKYQAKIDYLTEKNEKSKAANKYWNKNHDMSGFDGFSEETNQKLNDQFKRIYSGAMQRDGNLNSVKSPFSTDSTEIRRNKQQLEQLQNRKATSSSGGSGGGSSFKGGEIIRNTDMNRLQIKFDGIPDAATRQKLKSSGWRWSPKNGVWQRQLTDNAERSAKQITDELNKSFDGAKTFMEMMLYE